MLTFHAMPPAASSHKNQIGPREKWSKRHPERHYRDVNYECEIPEYEERIP